MWGCFVGSTTQKDLKTEAGTLQAHNIVFALENGLTAGEQIAQDRVEVTAVPRGADSEPVAVPFSYEGPVGTVWTTDIGEALGLEEGEQTSHVGEGVGPDGKTYRRLSLIDPMKQEVYDATLQGAVPVAGMTGEERKDMEIMRTVLEEQPEDPNEPVPIYPVPEDPAPDPDPEEPAPDPEEPAPDPQPEPAPEKPAAERPADPETGDDAADGHEVPEKVDTGPDSTPCLVGGGLAALTGGGLLTLRRRFGIG